ncbi:hypothetical protein [Micromonospora sp. NPDC005324]|uniref:hypothetical protein n=1 Tax=Micromonospora sp. NPDC005324 TaxID=3157033 RepID=UPI0033B9B318
MSDLSQVDPSAARVGPEAAIYLRRLLEDWRTSIVAHALQEQAARGITDSEITVSDIETAATKLRYATWDSHHHIHQSERRASRTDLLVTIGASAMLVTGVALVLLTSLRHRFDVTAPYNIAIVIGFLGTLLSAVGVYFERRARKHAGLVNVLEARLNQIELVRNWALLEKAMRSIGTGDVEGVDRLPLKLVIERYAEAAQLSDNDLLDIRVGLHARNRIAHEGGLDLSAEALADLERKISRQLTKARKVLQAMPSDTIVER